MQMLIQFGKNRFPFWEANRSASHRWIMPTVRSPEMHNTRRGVMPLKIHCRFQLRLQLRVPGCREAPIDAINSWSTCTMLVASKMRHLLFHFPSADWRSQTIQRNAFLDKVVTERGRPKLMFAPYHHNGRVFTTRSKNRTQFKFHCTGRRAHT